MSTQDDKKDVHGRSWDQITKHGTSSAGSMGVGGTGDSGKLQGDGSEQAAGRTDDLLDDGSAPTGDKGFSSGGGRVETGLEGIGNLTGGAKGNRQSTQPEAHNQHGSQGARASDEGRDEDPASTGRQNR
ncbi:hypothetical protein ACHAC9_02185 [Massilia sp. CMS3.1]|uniref:hypothetical protein n=1 Tax=Massilia sp. CMS3.1 TaxID=3373083 RepID=UPI003EE5E9B5